MVLMMMFQVSGITKDYVIAELDNIYGGDGATYTGKRALLEYNVGDVAMENLSNQTDKFGLVKVKIVFQRRWFYHGITVFLQSRCCRCHIRTIATADFGTSRQ